MSSDDSTGSLLRLCGEFELAWSTGNRPWINVYANRVDDSLRGRLIKQLIPIDIKYRKASGESVFADDYRALGIDTAWITAALLNEMGPGNEAPIASESTHEPIPAEPKPVPAIDATTLPGKSKPDRGWLGTDARDPRFGDYELMEEIARGGMGVVYKARQTKLKRTVALKMILAGCLASDDEIRRFYSEAESAACLEHSGIVPIYEVGQVGEQHFFSMALVEGTNLAKVLQQGPLKPDRAADYVGQIADAIAYAHAHNVIHRDLKPANVLLDENDRVKVTDFGLAKQTQLDTQLTATGQIMGTPGYMPPEQASGKLAQVDQTSDVYSMGAVLYCLLTGRPPFQAATPVETLVQVLEQDPVPPRVLVPGIPRDLETICLKCLHKEQHRRYSSAAELAAEINRFENGLPILARRVSGLERTIRWMKQQSQPLWVSTLTGLAVTMCLAIGLVGRFAYQQSLLGYVDLRTNEEEGYLVATIFNDEGKQVECQTLPTQEPIPLSEGSYRVRLSGARRMSKDIQLEVQRGSRRQPFSPELSLNDTALWPTIEHDGIVEFLKFQDRDDAILIDDQFVIRRSGASGKTIWKTNIAESVKPLDETEMFRWWNNFGNKSNGQRNLRTRPTLLQSPTDLDGDRVRDLVFSGGEQAWLLALSGETGKPLWFRRLDELDPTAKRKVNLGSSLLDSAIVHPPVAIPDTDRDDVDDVLTVVFDLGDDRNQPPRRWLELTSGKNGGQIWTRELDGSWFDEQNIPLDLRWLHTGSGVISKGQSWGGFFQRDRSTVFETGAAFFSTSPPLFSKSPNSNVIWLLAGDRLVRLHAETGEIQSFALGFVPLKTPEVADLDDDGSDEFLFLIVNDPDVSSTLESDAQSEPTPQEPTELIVWSTATNQVDWRKKLFSTWGAVRKLGNEFANWPCTEDLNGDGALEVIVPDETSNVDGSGMSAAVEKPFGGLSVFDADGNLIWKQKLASPREQLDRFVPGPDINDDGWRDLFVVTNDVRANQGIWDRQTIVVDAISGRDGERVWWNRQALQTRTQRFEYGETLRWWNPGNDGWPQLLVGVKSDLFAFSPRTGNVTGYGHFIDSILVADGNGDDLDDLFFLRKGHLGSYRGRMQLNWMRSPMNITRSADVDGDGIDDFAFGNRMVSGSDGKTLWQNGVQPGPIYTSSPDESMFVLDVDLNNDGCNDVLANSQWQRGRTRIANLLSGKNGQRIWDTEGNFSEKPVWNSSLIEVKSGASPSGRIELTAIINESREAFNGNFYSLEPGHTWLLRIDGKSGKLNWKVPLLATEIGYPGMDFTLHDLNHDGILDVLAPASAVTDNTGSIVDGTLQLRAYDGNSGSLIWQVPVVPLAHHQIASFPKLTVGDTPNEGTLVAFYDHRTENGVGAGLRVINGATGDNQRFPLNWTEPMPETTQNEVQLPWPVVIQDHVQGKHFFAVSVWTRQPGVTTDWEEAKLDNGIAEELVILDAAGKIVSRFGLPLVRGNRFRANRARLWAYDTNQDGVDELILLDHAGCTAIDPFHRERVWSWMRPQATDLRLHSMVERSNQASLGLVAGKREVFGIDLSNGTQVWSASDKFPDNESWSHENFFVLECQTGNPRVLLMNDDETVCVTPRSESSLFHGDRLMVPSERLPQNDPLNLRLLPWVEPIPFVQEPEPLAAALEASLGALVSLPLLFLFVIVPWFWIKHVVRKRRFSIQSLLLLMVFCSVGIAFTASRRSFVPEPFKFSYETLAVGIGIVLPPVVFLYSVIRMMLLGQWKTLKWISVVILVITAGFAISAVVAAVDFDPGEVYSYEYGWTLILWISYLVGALLMILEGVRVCWRLVRMLYSKIRRKPKPLALA